MSDASPAHGAVYVQELAQYLIANGHSEQAVFEGTGIPAHILDQDKPVVAFDKVAQFFEHAAELTGNDVLGFQRGAKREMRRSGLICYVGLASPTVMDFINNIARYRRVFSDAVEIDVNTLSRDSSLRWHFAVPTSVGRRQYVEFGASGLVYALRQATNRNFSLAKVTFRHPRRTNLDRFRDFFHCPVEFGAPHNAMYFKPTDLELPLLTADNNLYSVLTDYCEAVLSDKSRNLPPIIVAVERAVVDRMASGELNQNMIARDLGMSARTLSRRLSQVGTTFFKVVEQLRAALAVNYLKDSELALAEIAFLLGYSGLSSFNDAFKRWTGKTPGQYRSV